MDARPLLQGWLEKKKQTNKSSYRYAKTGTTKRWFVIESPSSSGFTSELIRSQMNQNVVKSKSKYNHHQQQQQEEITLSYYHSPSSVERSGWIFLSDVSCITHELLSSSGSSGHSHGHGHGHRRGSGIFYNLEDLEEKVGVEEGQEDATGTGTTARGATRSTGVGAGVGTDWWIILEHPSRTFHLRAYDAHQHQLWYETLKKFCINARHENDNYNGNDNGNNNGYGYDDYDVDGYDGNGNGNGNGSGSGSGRGGGPSLPKRLEPESAMRKDTSHHHIRQSGSSKNNYNNNNNKNNHHHHHHHDMKSRHDIEVELDFLRQVNGTTTSKSTICDATDDVDNGSEEGKYDYESTRMYAHNSHHNGRDGHGHMYSDEGGEGYVYDGEGCEEEGGGRGLVDEEMEERLRNYRHRYVNLNNETLEQDDNIYLTSIHQEKGKTNNNGMEEGKVGDNHHDDGIVVIEEEQNDHHQKNTSSSCTLFVPSSPICHDDPFIGTARSTCTRSVNYSMIGNNVETKKDNDTLPPASSDLNKRNMVHDDTQRSNDWLAEASSESKLDTCTRRDDAYESEGRIIHKDHGVELRANSYGIIGGDETIHRRLERAMQIHTQSSSSSPSTSLTTLALDTHNRNEEKDDSERICVRVEGEEVTTVDNTKVKSPDQGDDSIPSSPSEGAMDTSEIIVHEFSAHSLSEESSSSSLLSKSSPPAVKAHKDGEGGGVNGKNNQNMDDTSDFYHSTVATNNFNYDSPESDKWRRFRDNDHDDSSNNGDELSYYSSTGTSGKPTSSSEGDDGVKVNDSYDSDCSFIPDADFVTADWDE